MRDLTQGFRLKQEDNDSSERNLKLFFKRVQTKVTWACKVDKKMTIAWKHNTFATTKQFYAPLNGQGGKM